MRRGGRRCPPRRAPRSRAGGGGSPCEPTSQGLARSVQVALVLRRLALVVLLVGILPLSGLSALYDPKRGSVAARLAQDGPLAPDYLRRRRYSAADSSPQEQELEPQVAAPHRRRLADHREPRDDAAEA